MNEWRFLLVRVSDRVGDVAQELDDLVELPGLLVVILLEDDLERLLPANELHRDEGLVPVPHVVDLCYVRVVETLGAPRLRDGRPGPGDVLGVLDRDVFATVEIPGLVDTPEGPLTDQLLELVPLGEDSPDELIGAREERVSPERRRFLAHRRKRTSKALSGKPTRDCCNCANP